MSQIQEKTLPYGWVDVTDGGVVKERHDVDSEEQSREVFARLCEKYGTQGTWPVAWIAKYRISFLGGSISSLVLSTPEDESDEDSREKREARRFDLLTAQDDLRGYEIQVGHVLDDATIRVCLELIDAAVEEMEAKRDETAEAAAVHAENMDALRQWADEGDAEQPR